MSKTCTPLHVILDEEGAVQAAMVAQIARGADLYFVARRNRRLFYAYSLGNRTLDRETAMPTNRREQLLQLYHLALAREGEDRNAFLADACAGDEELRHEVEALLSREPPSDFLGVSASFRNPHWPAWA